jgi:hypothetical protein
MTDILEKKIVMPAINWNGTDGNDLINQYRTTYEAFQPLLDAMAKATPHGRDYQTLPAGTFEKAQKQHTDMILKLVDIQDTITAIALDLIRQQDERGGK